MYKQVKDPMTGEICTTNIEKRVDGKIWYIPCDPNNTDYQEYLKWCNGEYPFTEKGTIAAPD